MIPFYQYLYGVSVALYFVSAGKHRAVYNKTSGFYANQGVAKYPWLVPKTSVFNIFQLMPGKTKTPLSKKQRTTCPPLGIPLIRCHSSCLAFENKSHSLLSLVSKIKGLFFSM